MHGTVSVLQMLSNMAATMTVDVERPYFLVGDEIFPLTNWLMRPFSGKSLVNEKHKISNYRLSPARRVIEKSISWQR